MILTSLVLVLSSTAAPPGNLRKELFYASELADGHALCDRKLAAKLAQRFERRYGARIQRLQAAHVARFGPDAEFIYITQCRRITSRGTLAAAFNGFDRKLHVLETVYGQAAGEGNAAVTALAPALPTR